MAASGSNTPYCNGDDLEAFIDERMVNKLGSDTGQDATDGYSNPIFLDLVNAACGELESACMVGGKYTADMLANLTGNATSFRNSIIAGIVIGLMRDRRVVVSEKEVKQYDRATFLLKQLREGIKIFPFTEVQDARTMSSRDESVVAKQNRNEITSEAYRYFGGDSWYC